ncbi:hypothetical protein [Halorubrum sp. CSM-61]|uniref:hypothetical protein n=1 Tax=Halorubrum sp. CSM-61 TaxID=2485838 RepID=UPI000F4CD930|nr:hypothetical protein [Halorubrum sp. CSM-61]
MEEVTDTKLYEYTTEVIVEVIGIDNCSDCALGSYQFALSDRDGIIRSKADIEDEPVSHVESTL